jgi:DNA polymerase (family X)
VENAAIARVLGEIADLLEIKGDNPFRIRAYRNAAQAVADAGLRVAELTDADLRAIPGIGKDIAGRIRELAEHGRAAYHDELRAEFPPGLTDLLRLQGVGPRSVALMHRELGIGSLEDLEAAARAGRLRAVKGMGARKEAQLLEAIAERRRFSGRHLASFAAGQGEAIVTHLRTVSAEAMYDLVGSLRRGAETVGDLDILATLPGAGSSGEPTGGAIMQAFVSLPNVERVLGHGDTKSSVLLARGLQADLRLVAPDQRGAAQQYFTGSKAHNIELRDRALRRGLRLNEYGLYTADLATRLAGTTEAEIYAALDLPWMAPELREMRGEFAAAEAGTLPTLVELDDLRGDLHCHTTESDGKDTLEAMVDEARRRGLAFLAITDHSQALAMANGLDERRALAHAARIRALDAQLDDITLLAGIECDIRPDGTLDLDTDCLAELDIVVASVHSALNQEPAEMTDRVLRALECPWVDILGHPTGRMLLRRDASGLDVGRVIDAAVRLGVALEINGQPHRRDLNDAHARLAVERGATLVLSSDAHGRAGFDHLHWATLTARRAWVTPSSVLNCRAPQDLRASLRRHRKGSRP